MTLEQLILQALKKEYESTNSDPIYSQWVMALAVSPFQAGERTTHLQGDLPTHTARVILKASTSPYVDGTDVYFTVNLDDNIADLEKWAYIWADYEPIFHGGTVPAALNWIKEFAEPFYIQMDAPAI